jgi:uncharacterized protein
VKIVIPGGSGQVGTLLARAMHARGDTVVVVARHPRTMPWREVAWNGRDAGAWTSELDGADVVINLAGRSVNCRYSVTNRAEIKRSRVDSTRAVGAAIAAAVSPPPVWLQMSTATIYAHRFDAPNDEATGILGGAEPNVPDTWRFSIDVAQSWEAAALETVSPRTRLVLLRTAIVMSADRGGVFDTLLGLVRVRLGGQAGDGRQFLSWIHGHDFVRAVRWIIDHEALSGAINVAAPHPLPNAAFMAALRQAWGVRIGLRAAAWMIEIGAVALRTESELVLKSRRVVPGRLLASGFTFEQPEWPAAARQLCEAWRARTADDLAG